MVDVRQSPSVADNKDPYGLLGGNPQAAVTGAVNPNGGKLPEGQYIGLPDSVPPAGMPDPARGPLAYQPGGSVYSEQVPAAAQSSQFQPYKQGDEYKLRDLPPETISQIQMAMKTAGLLSKDAGIVTGTVDNTTLGAWRELLGISNRQGMNPFAVLQQAAQNAQSQQALRRSATSTSTSVNLTDPVTAHAIARNAIAQATGRAPTEDEYQSFLSSLNGMEQANPSVTSSTTTYDPNGDTHTTSTNSGTGAPSPTAFADEFVHKGKLGVEANTYAAATDFYKQAMQVLGAGGGMGAGL